VPATPGPTVNVNIRYFAIIRELLGRSTENRQVADGSTVGQLFDELTAQHPGLDRMRPVTMMMVNQQYVSSNHTLHDGDEVALIPPVSGGASRPFRIQSEPLDPRQVESSVADPSVGAIVTFVGTVRNHGRGRQVLRLDYEAYAPAAETILRQIGDEIRERWGLDNVAIVHRVGSLSVGEASVVISIASAHRDAAFDACRYTIERIKEIVPIWKKEHYSDGAVWVGSEHEYQTETGRLAD
jgi:molybdopterin converting factor subunit 1